METGISFPDKGKIGYALGGGAARGLFHIGVLGVLEEHGVYPDVIAGTSMGSIIGALYASGFKASDLKRIALDMDWRQIVRLSDIPVPLNGLISGRNIIALLKSILKDRTFSQLKIPYSCVATDLISGEQVVFDDGSLIEAVRASISIPLIFTPVKVRGRVLVDGGLVNVVPVSVCRDMGADFVIGVNAIPGPGEKVSIQDACKKYYDSNVKQVYAARRNSLQSASQVSISRVEEMNRGVKRFLRSILFGNGKQKTITYTDMERLVPDLLSGNVSLFDVISQTFTIIQHRIAMDNIKDADLAVSPFTGNIGFWQFNRAKEAINAGEIAARLALHRDDVVRIMLQQRS